jgi:hypothetical protein
MKGCDGPPHLGNLIDKKIEAARITLFDCVS